MTSQQGAARHNEPCLFFDGVK